MQTVTVITPELDMTAAIGLDDDLCELLPTHKGEDLEIDMANVTYIGSAALGVMLAHEPNFKSITLLNVHEKVKNVMEILGLDLILKVK